MTILGALGGGNDGLTSATNTATLTLPNGCMPGHVAMWIVTSNLPGQDITSVTPGGVRLSGKDTVGGNNTTYLYYRVLTASDIAGGSITTTFSGSGRILASGQVHKDVNIGTGLGDGIIMAYGNTIATPASLPTINTTGANWFVGAYAAARVGSGTAAVASYPTGYTTDNSSVTNFASGVQYSCSAAHRTTTGEAGTYGGGSISWSGSFSNANMYVVGLAPAATNTGKLKVWDGSAWVSHPAKVWNGSAWVQHPVKVWNGTSWVLSK